MNYNIIGVILSLCLVTVFAQDPVKKCYECTSNDPTEKCHTGVGFAYTDLVDCADKCFTSKVNGAVNRGCSVGATTCADDGTCEKCDGVKCNGKPLFKECIVCDSTVNPDCATATNLAGSSCPNLAFSCHVGINAAGATKRGCGNSPAELPIQVSCITEKCNDKLYPSDRLACKKCSFADNCEDASTLPSSVCLKYVEKNECYSALNIDGKFTRDCNSDLPQPCVDNTCEKCNTKDCNVHKKEKPAVLKCIFCENSAKECEWLYDAKEAKTCKNVVQFGQKEECFINVDDKKVNRGCKLEKPEKCDGKCETCGEDACNIKNISVNKCIVCDSSVDSQKTCSEKAEGIGSTLCSDQTLAGFGCFTHKNDKNIVTRGCKSDLSADQKKDCDDEKNCSICTGDGCNNEVPKTQDPVKKCYECTSNDPTEKCHTGVGFAYTDLVDCADKCFTSKVNGVVTRGCSAGATTCAADGTCEKCDGVKCNGKPLFKECIVCDSTVNADCATATNLAGSSCPNLAFSCHVGINAAGATKRGCGNSLAELTIQMSCITEKCNDRLYPSGRLMCKKCLAFSGNCEDASTLKSSVCVKYVEMNECYTAVDKDGKFARECYSDLPQPCVDNICEKCSTNGCNIHKNVNTTPNDQNMSLSLSFSLGINATIKCN